MAATFNFKSRDYIFIYTLFIHLLRKSQYSQKNIEHVVGIYRKTNANIQYVLLRYRTRLYTPLIKYLSCIWGLSELHRYAKGCVGRDPAVPNWLAWNLMRIAKNVPRQIKLIWSECVRIHTSLYVYVASHCICLQVTEFATLFSSAVPTWSNLFCFAVAVLLLYSLGQKNCCATT